MAAKRTTDAVLAEIETAQGVFCADFKRDDPAIRKDLWDRYDMLYAWGLGALVRQTGSNFDTAELERVATAYRVLYRMFLAEREWRATVPKTYYHNNGSRAPR